MSVAEIVVVPPALVVLAKHVESGRMPFAATGVNMIAESSMPVMTVKGVVITIVPMVRPVVAFVPVSVVSVMWMYGLVVVVMVGIYTVR